MGTTIKSTFYRFCFCLGLGTAAYHSFAQVQSWVKGDDSSAPTTSVFQDKVKVLFQNEALKQGAPRAQTFIAKIPQTLPLVTAPGVTTDAVVAASPSPAEGEKKEGEEVKTAENAEGTPGVLPEAIPLNPYGYQYPEAHAQEKASSDAKSSDGLSQNSSPLFNAPLIGANGAATSNYNGSNGSSNGPSGTSTFGSLTSQDVSVMTASSVQAAFSDQQNHVDGYVCAAVTTSCSYQNDVAVHSLRWGMQEGLQPAVNFAVAPSNGASPVEFDVSFQIQDQLLNNQTVSMVAQPNNVNVRTETRESGNYKVYEFTMPDATVRDSEQLVNMKAKLVYQVAANGAMVMTNESQFTFARDQVQTSSSMWNPGGATATASLRTMLNRAPATTPEESGDSYFVADELVYSMSLHTAQ